ncbi:MAG: DNA-binding protein [Halomonas sp.]|nr:DNA-binding protein [Halomonas sp.]MCA1772440.1 DNA-binding protein [Halomonas sp.]
MSRQPSLPPTAGISYEQVAAAAENLEGRGAEPTLQRVCEHLGAGSPNRIQRHLSAWRAARPAPAPPTPRLPESLIGALEEELARHASAALSRGEQLAEEARSDAASLAELGETMEQRLAELETRAVTAESAAEQALARRDELQTGFNELRENLGSEQREARTHREALLQTRQQVEMLREQLEEAVQARLAAERQTRDADAERIKAERSQAVAETQRDSALVQVREKTEQHAELQKELQAERARQRQEIAELRSEQKQRADAMERARHEALKQAQEAAQRASKAEIRAEALQATQAALKSRMDAMQVQQRQRSLRTSGGRPSGERD